MLNDVVLHVGSPKTGTSIIQSHLAQNRPALRDRGFFYPVTISSYAHLYRTFESHHLLTYSLAGWEPFKLYDPQRFLERARTACERHHMRTMLLSAENTWWLPRQVVARERPDEATYWQEKHDYARRVRALFEDLPVRVVVYLRRQDRWIESWYNQQIKNGNFLGRDMAAFVEHHHLLLDYRRLLEVWSESFGQENVVVRPYEKQQLPDGLFADFAATVGLGDTGDYPLHKPARYNAQLQRDALEFMHLCNGLQLDAADKLWLRLLIRKVTNQFESKLVFHQQSLLDPRQRIAVLERYREANEDIARRYLGRSGGDLFREAWPSHEDDWSPYPGLRSEVAVELLVPIIMRVASEEFRREKRADARRKFWNERLKPLRAAIAPLVAKRHERADERLWQQRMWDHA